MEHTATQNTTGLTAEQVIRARQQFGPNKLTSKKTNRLLASVVRILKEPMVILLIVAGAIYAISGKTGDALFLLAAICFQASISTYQYSRSKDALEKLKKFSQPACKVIRDGQVQEIKSEDVVMGDQLMMEEGTLVVADGDIIHSNDFSVDESILTGESLPVFKNRKSGDHAVYSGTTVASGLAIAVVTAVGNDTRLGKIGKSLGHIREEKTPLELQIARFVRNMAITGTCIFIVVWIIHYSNSQSLLTSLLASLTLAMSILPEEIPVAFTTFMALGAWRLMKTGIVVRQMKTVETLGSATVICVDKTGTITENTMSLAKVFVFSAGKLSDLTEPLTAEEQELITIGMWASEPIPFDPMETALHNSYASFTDKDERRGFKLIHEYPLSGKPPMMTHVFEDSHGNRIVAAKGALEAVMRAASLSPAEQDRVNRIVHAVSGSGHRVLGVAEAVFTGKDFPADQHDLPFQFKGVIAFYDPPKHNIAKTLEAFYNAGISVKIITGDNAETTTAIAQQIHFRGWEKTISGDELMQLEGDELADRVMSTTIFTRMYPEAKLRVIEALKSRQQVVAMTGDGVNDGPALKAAHIGIAMGKRGTEIAKEAASLILLEDDLSKMVDAVEMGRKIYSNLKKAIRYIISIHIPIILTVFVPLALGWIYPTVFSPIHVIFLEIVMGPTCSIVYENEPIEQNLMQQKPKLLSVTFFHWRELGISIIQGLVITAGTLFVYWYAVHQGYDEALTRTMIFTGLVVANIFLTLVNRSFYYSFLTTLKYRNSRVLYIIAITAIILALQLLLPPMTSFFEFQRLTISQFLISACVGIGSVTWFELVKGVRRKRDRQERSGKVQAANTTK